MIPRAPDDERDAWLCQALRHAPDANAEVPSALSATILREARSLRFARDGVVFHQGAAAHSFFVLLHGHLRVEKATPQGQQVVIRTTRSMALLVEKP